jgi:hypothetical protein
MSNRTLNLEIYTIQDIKKNMANLFDSDYNGDNGDENWEYSGEEDEDGREISLAEKLGFETEAERFISEIYDEESDDVTNIEVILEKIGDCWGSQADQFQYSVEPVGYDNETYIVAIAMLT